MSDPGAEFNTSVAASNLSGQRRRQRTPRHGTDYVQADTSLCEACGDCVEACPSAVLSVKGPWFHRHVRFDHPEECRGCGRCVSACTHGAMVLIA
ncbi:MAG: 4Fe-4S binding protein [Thermoleophilia bacterium]|nr:4Fe-4S binding protein [Thermoleophilia bacterium]